MAANKAESAVAQLPLPLGNTLKGEVEATLVNVDDAYPAPLVTTKVMGQSNQQQEPAPSPENPQEITNLNKAELVVAGKNLINPNRLAQIDSSYYQAVDGQLKVIGSHNAAWKDVPIYGTLQAGTYTISGDNIEIRDAALNQIVNINSTPQVNQFTLENPTVIKIKVGFALPEYPVISKAQLEVGSKATTYESHKSKSTVIDLQSNELCSIPNGVKDEVVIDADGNVSLVKRVAKYVVPENVYAQDEANNFGVKLDLNAVDNKYLHEQLCPENSSYSPSLNWLVVYKRGNSWANLQEFKQWLIGTEFYYGTKNPETIPLGKVELPALPESTSNIWNNGNIQTDVGIVYVRDINIVIGRLDDKLAKVSYNAV